MDTIQLEKYLHSLEARIDEEQEAACRAAWGEFLADKFEGDLFEQPARRPNPAQVAWPEININDTIDDTDAMLLQQFKRCSDQLDSGRSPLNVRCNYGTGIMPCLFGCDMFVMPREMNTLPAAKPLASTDRIRELVDAGVPDLRTGLGGKVFDTAELFLDVFHRYPKIGRNVHLYHPDMQGPIDVAEVVWGSEIFYAFYDAPDLLRDFLNLVTETYVAFMRKWCELVPPAGDYSAHWGFFHKGVLMIRNDSLMNLSPETYVEFIRPLDQRLFDEFGGGAIHFCGRGDHYIGPMSAMSGLTAIQLSQPQLNDMETIYRNTVDKGIKLLGLAREVGKSADRPLLGRVHVS